MKEDIQKLTENDNNRLLWENQKQKLILRGMEIMNKKSNVYLDTYDFHQIVEILIKEVITFPQYFDPVKNDNQKIEIIKELQEKAKVIAENIIKERIERDKRKEGERRYGGPGCCRRHQPHPSYFRRTQYRGISIVDGLKSINVNSSYAYRAIIAERNGIQDYKGTPQQNALMLRLLQEGRLITP